MQSRGECLSVFWSFLWGFYGFKLTTQKGKEMKMEIDLEEIYNGSFYNFWDEMNEYLDKEADTVLHAGDSTMTLTSNLAITYLVKTFIGLDELSMMVKEIVVRG